MTKNPSTLPPDYPIFLADIKDRIRSAQMHAALSVNHELILLYWSIGQALGQRQRQAGWGAKVIPRLARDIEQELPDLKGFSETNLKRMVAFAREYPALSAMGQQPVAPLPDSAKGPSPAPPSPPDASRAILQRAAQLVKGMKATRAASSSPGNDLPPVTSPPVTSAAIAALLKQAAASSPGSAVLAHLAARMQPNDPESLMLHLATRLPWGHNVILMEKVKDRPTRLWYMQQTLAQGWSRSALHQMIDSAAHERHGRAVTNFADRLPPRQSDLAQQTLKDPYLFEFLSLREPFQEREMENELIRQVEKFLVELGQGFAFVGRQYRLEVGDEEFYIDLLFYHLRLRCFVVIDLKTDAFKAEYAGQMNFYCSVVDEHLRHPDDNPTIGIILCRDKNHLVAEYALKGMQKAIGVSQYKLRRTLPVAYRSSLPSVEEFEKLLSTWSPEEQARANAPRKRRTKKRKRKMK